MIRSKTNYFDFDQKTMIFRIQNDNVRRSWCKENELNFSKERRLITKRRKFENWNNFLRLYKVLLLKRLKESIPFQLFYELYIEILSVFKMKIKLSQPKINIKLCMNLLNFLVLMHIYLKRQVLRVHLWRNKCLIIKSNQSITQTMKMWTQ